MIQMEFNPVIYLFIYLFLFQHYMTSLKISYIVFAYG